MNPNIPFTKYLLAEGFLPEEDLFLVDVGASGGIDRAWLRLEPHLRAVGFDPLVNEVTRLNRLNTSSKITYVDAFIGGKANEKILTPQMLADKIDIRSNMSFGRSSSLRAEKLGKMNYQKEIFNSGQDMVFSQRRIDLDEYFQGAERERVDFIKVDTDGFDYQVLTGAKELLESGSVLGLTVESQFHGPVHDEANLFCNIDRFLRARGFSLYDLQVYQYSRAELPRPFAANIPAQTVAGQIQWGEALYFRDLGDADYERMWQRNFEVSKLIKLACLFEMFNLQDCAVELILRHRLAFEKVLPVERCLDLLTPPLHGQAIRYEDYQREFNAWASRRQWLPFGRQRAPLEEQTNEIGAADAFELKQRMGSFLGRESALGEEEISEAQAVIRMILSASDASGTIDRLKRQGAVSPAVMPVLLNYLGQAWKAGDTGLAEVLELIWGRLGFRAQVK
jgi:FkbM family methyltransferase